MLKPTTLLVVLLTLLSTNTHAQTNISGQIRQNTTWTKAGSPYILSGLVEIAPNVTLTIDPGVKIVSEDRIMVYGSIKAIGTKSDSIRFSQTYRDAKYIMIIDHTKAGDTTTFKYCVMDHTHIAIKDVSRLDISNSYLYYSSAHASKGSDMTIQDSRIRYGDSYLANADSCVYRNNIIQYGYLSTRSSIFTEYTNNYITSAKYGIECASNDVKMVNNIITKTSQAGIIILSGANVGFGQPFSDNIIFGNYGAGISLNNAKGVVSGNSIFDNQSGVKYYNNTSNGTITIKNNCIYNNKYNFYNNTEHAYHVDSNWWGTTDSSIIESTFYDYDTDFKKGHASFMPILTQSGNLCKTYKGPFPTNTKNIINRVTDDAITTSPNPFHNSVSLKAEGINTIKEVRIYNLVGELVVNERYDNEKQVSINTTDLAPGIYIHHTTLDNNTKLTGKIIRQ